MAKEPLISKRRRSSPSEKKSEIAEQAPSMRADRTSWFDVCREMDVLDGSLWLWMQQHAVEVRQVLPVRVLRTEPETQHLCVVMPDGIRIEGLDLDGAVQLVEMLRC
jgi:transposase-like protein